MVLMRQFGPNPCGLQQGLDRISRANYGVLWNEVLDGLGVSPSQRRRRVELGIWRRPAKGIYVVSAVPPSWEQCLMVQCRRVPGRVWVAARAAAALWNLDGFEDRLIEVVTTADIRSGGDREHIRRIRAMPSCDVTVLRGLPVTTMHRTLIDIGETSARDDVELAYECARRRRQTNDERLKRRLQDLGLKGRKGCATLSRIIALHQAKPPTDSALEVRFLQLNRRFRLPDPELQSIIKDRDGAVVRVDFIYPGTVVIVEVDGRSIHARARRLESDLRRRNRLTSDGYLVLHVTYERMRTDPSGVAREIATALARRLG